MLSIDVDLVSLCDDTDVLFVTDGVGIVGIGCAFRLVVPRGEDAPSSAVVAHALGDVERLDNHDMPGTGAVGLGAFPFNVDEDGELIVPRIAIGRSALLHSPIHKAQNWKAKQQ